MYVSLPIYHLVSEVLRIPLKYHDNSIPFDRKLHDLTSLWLSYWDFSREEPIRLRWWVLWWLGISQGIQMNSNEKHNKIHKHLKDLGLMIYYNKKILIEHIFKVSLAHIFQKAGVALCTTSCQNKAMYLLSSEKIFRPCSLRWVIAYFSLSQIVMALHIYLWSDSSSLNLNHLIEIKAQQHVTYAQFCIFHVTFKAIKGKSSLITHLFLEAWHE